MVRGHRGTKLALLAGALMAFGGGLDLGAARAADLDYARLFREHALKCLHPTAHVEQATIEVVKGPEKHGDVSTARLKVFYKGLIRKHSMDADLMVREAGTIRQMKVDVLADSGAEMHRCELTKNWVDF